MIIKSTDPYFQEYRVSFNGRVAPYVINASEEEGYITVIDTNFIGMVASISQESNQVSDDMPDEIESIPIKKLYGKVEIKRLARK